MKDDSTVTIGASAPSTAPATESTESRGALEEGQRVGHYRVGERLGRGGFGEVWSARHDTIARDVAIKVLHEKYSRDATAVARFVAEAKAASTIDHPNIVQVFDFGALPDGRRYFVMELLRGRSLKQILEERGALPLAEALPLLVAIAEAVDAAHAVGLAHRDLKPDNVFVLTDGRVKVIDFGLAKLVLDEVGLTDTGVIAGTPLYMSPEQFRGKDIGLGTDAYSFGVLAYHVLVGEPPFVATSAVSLGVMHVNEAPPTPSRRRPELGTGVDRCILALLAKDPLARPPTLIDALALLDVSEPSRPRRPRRKVLGMGLAAVLLATSVTVAIAIRTHEAPFIGPPVVTTVSVRAAPIAGANLAKQDRTMLEDAAPRLLSRKLHDVPNRTFGLVARDATDPVEMAITVDAHVVSVEVRHGAWTTRAGGDSLAQAIDALAPAVAAELSRGHFIIAPDPDEVSGMAIVGAPTLDAYRQYRAIADDNDRSWWINTKPLSDRIAALERAYPTWLRPYMLSCVAVHSRDGATCDREYAAAVAHHAVGDPVATQMLELATRRPPPAERVRTLDAIPGVRADTSTALLLTLDLFFAHRVDDSIALLRELYARRPDLQYGANLVWALRQSARGSEADALIEDWAARRPEAEQALLALVMLDVTRNHLTTARDIMRRRTLLLGEDPGSLPAICNAYIALGDFTSARRIVDELLAGDREARARGRYRAGTIATLQGRFAAAFDTYRRSIDDQAGMGLSSELPQTIRGALALARVVGDPTDVHELTERLHAMLAAFPAVQAPVTYELALLDHPRTCPAVEPMLATLTEAYERATARRRILRDGVESHCSTCRDVIAAGTSELEPSARSLMQFAACAEREHEPALARLALQRAVEIDLDSAENSVFDGMLAAARLAPLLLAAGDREGARHYFELVLQRWGNAERDLPEIQAARKGLASLDAK